MASAGALIVSMTFHHCVHTAPLLTPRIVSCDEADTRVDPSRYFNLSATTTRVIKTPGGRTTPAVNNIYFTDQASRIGMIIVVQHTSQSFLTSQSDRLPHSKALIPYRLLLFHRQR